MIKILESGFQATIQDLGRHGYYHYGVPPSGAADKVSFQIGNILVGNPSYCAALEIALLGPKIEIYKDTVIAITGAPVRIFLNHESVSMWQAIKVKNGDVLEFHYSEQKVGVFTYLCLSGGINSEEKLGSRSTYTHSDFDGVLSRKLEVGDVLEVSEPLPGAFNYVGKHIPDETLLPSFSNQIDVHAVMGLTSDWVSDQGIANFLNNKWKVEFESNRVAYRFNGDTIPYKDYTPPFGGGTNVGNVLDSAYPIGSILIPNPDEVIVLLNDATLGGGFITIGTVISPDLSLITQARPGSFVRFHAVTANQATKIRSREKMRLNKIKEIINQCNG